MRGCVMLSSNHSLYLATVSEQWDAALTRLKAFAEKES